MRVFCSRRLGRQLNIIVFPKQRQESVTSTQQLDDLIISIDFLSCCRRRKRSQCWVCQVIHFCNGFLLVHLHWVKSLFIVWRHRHRTYPLSSSSFWQLQNDLVFIYYNGGDNDLRRWELLLLSSNLLCCCSRKCLKKVGSFCKKNKRREREFRWCIKSNFQTWWWWKRAWKWASIHQRTTWHDDGWLAVGQNDIVEIRCVQMHAIEVGRKQRPFVPSPCWNDLWSFP